MYGKFSQAYFEQNNKGSKVLLEDPSLLYENDMLAMTSALWYYMTPQSSQPSAHEVITGLFTLDENSSSLNIRNDFSTTISLMAYREVDECDKRADIFDFFIQEFDL